MGTLGCVQRIVDVTVSFLLSGCVRMMPAGGVLHRNSKDERVRF